MITIRCPHCNKLAELSDKPFKDEPGADRQTHPDRAIEATARLAATPPAPPAPPAPAPELPKPDAGIGVRGYRHGISSSPIHSSVLSNNEIPPLKKLQPRYDTPTRSVSPMSMDGFNDPRPHRPHAPFGSAFDEPNPNRSNGKA